MKGLLGVALGVVTSIGGFVEAGSISTAVQAGAEFRFALLWAIAIAALCAAALVEMIEASRSWDTQLKMIDDAREMDSASASLMQLPR